MGDAVGAHKWDEGGHVGDAVAAEEAVAVEDTTCAAPQRMNEHP